MRRRTRLAVAAGTLATLGAFLIAPVASAQGRESMLAVRGIDGTDKENVQVTFLYTGAPQELEDLTIREDGQTKKINELTNLSKTDQGLRTVYVVDTSGSMGDDGALSDVKEGLKSLARSLPEGDEIAIVSFSDAVVLETGFTDNTDQLDDAIEGLVAPRDGKGATWDGVRKATQLLDTPSDLQPNIVLITDGKDDASKTDIDSARASVVTSGAAFFAIDLDHAGGTDATAVQSIMDRTGGGSFTASKGKGTEQAFEDLAATLQSQYVASYSSSATQGQVDVAVSVGSLERQASYVAGANVQGAATAEFVEPSEGFGPEWLRGKLGGAVGLALVGLAVGLGAYAVASLASSTDESLNAVLRPYSEGPVAGDEMDGQLAQTALLQRAVELTEEFAERQGFLVKVERALERADLPLRAAEALFFYGAGAVLLSLLVMALAGFTLGLITMGLTLLVPPAVVNFLAAKRGKKFQSALPDTLNLLSGSLRAGYSLLQGVEAVSKEVADPMGQELRRVITEARLGREIEDAMDAVAERMGSADFAWAVMAIRIQREVGGNLSELLLTVADTMVHRERLRRDISALTAEGKISAIILGLLPVGLGAFMWMSNPVYMKPLGATTMGHILLGVALLSLLIGFAWMKKIINIKI
ncbi:type II secretion system F family protein [Aquihabitans daechungensis]|uniref:type II secretion system F family protein n=1 Tax=Aquihabitans daechungensis TaxID=1052257 RepID=UPI003BA2A792